VKLEKLVTAPLETANKSQLGKNLWLAESVAKNGFCDLECELFSSVDLRPFRGITLHCHYADCVIRVIDT